MNPILRSANLPFFALLLVTACVGGVETPGTPTTSNHLPVAGSVTLEGTPREKGFLEAKPAGWTDEDGAAEAYRFNWLVNGKAVPKVTGDRIDGANYNKGDSVVVEIIPYDEEGDGEPVRSKATVIENTPPVLTSVSIGAGFLDLLEPRPFSTDDDIIGRVAGWQDDDDDAPGYQYAWQVDGVVVAGQTTPALPGSMFSKNNLVKVTVTPFDGDEAGTPVISNTVTIANSVPGVVSADIGAGPYYTDSTVEVLTISGWNDADGDTEGYTYAWLVNDTVVPAENDVSLAGANFEKGDTVQIVVTPTDGSVDGIPVYSNVVTIANSAPTVAAVSLGAGPFYTNSVLTTAGLAADLDGVDSPSIGYRWFVDGAVVGATTTSLNGATFFGKGQTVAVEMTPYDGFDYGTPVLSAAVSIENSLPSATSANIGTGPFYTNDTISRQSVTGWNDADGDAEGYQYVWYKGAVSLPTQTGTSLDGTTQFAKSDIIKLRVTPYDGTAAGASFYSNAVTIGNTAPVAQAPTLNAGPFYTDSTIIAAGQSTDADTETRTYDYRWYVNDAVVSGQVGASLTGTFFDRGQSVWVEARAYDGTAYSSYVSTVVGVIANKAPSAVGFTIQPSDVTTDTALIYISETAASTDADGDTPTVTYQWQKNNVDQGFPTSQTTVSGPFSIGDVWKAIVTSSDGQGGTTSSNVSEIVLFKAAGVGLGAYHGCSILTTGALRCWGWNSYLQTGVGSGNTGIPVNVAFASPVSQVTAGNQHTCALLDSGAVKCWGDPYQGKLGNNVDFGSNTATPQDVFGLGAGSGVIQIAAGQYHTCAVLNTGVVKCWGYNGYGQLGVSNSQQSYKIPVDAPGATNAVSITAGNFHTCAVRSTGLGVCWGYSYQGRLGNGSGFNGYTTSATVADISGIASIASGHHHSCALLTTGAIYCWGVNGSGQIGNGNQFTNYDRPQLVLASGGAAISLGERHSCALKTDGTIWCWGGNYDYNINNSYGAILTPVQTSITNAASIDTGDRHNCAVLNTGSVRCWGDNSQGQLGNDSATGDSHLGITPTGFIP